MNWQYKAKIKHLLTDKEDHESVQAAMIEIADVLAKKTEWNEFRYLEQFRKIPADHDFIEPVEYANLLMSKMYDYADANRIWIE